MAREAREETGLRLDPADLCVVHVMHRNAGPEERVDFFLSASQWDGTPEITEPDRCDELAWYPVGHLPQNMVPYVCAALDAYRDGLPYSEFGWLSSSG
jgi:8-oxo-dGTP diphosphatase